MYRLLFYYYILYSWCSTRPVGASTRSDYCYRVYNIVGPEQCAITTYYTVYTCAQRYITIIIIFITLLYPYYCGGRRRAKIKSHLSVRPFEWSAILPARESIEYLYYLNIITIGGPLRVQRVCRSPDARFGFD